MSLDRIYASKMYLTSTRKDRIHAAIQDPLNIELVQQVASYLDSDSKAKLQEAVAEKEAAEEAQVAQESAGADSEANVFDEGGSGMSGSHSSGSYHGGSGASGDVFDDFDAGEGGLDDSGSDMADDDFDAPDVDIDIDDTLAPEADVDVDIAESTEVIADDGIEVTSSEEEAPAIQSGIIKKLLNEQDDTKGVVRVDPTDDEVWIYYEDKVNLNDVMDNVITLIKNTYDALKFSRLARTDNAVVFDIKE